MRLVAVLALLSFALDQASKWLVLQRMNLGQLQQIDVLPPYLNLQMAWNTGVNFGLFAQGSSLTRWLLIAVALAICAGVVVWLIRAPQPPLARVSAGLLLGGAAGNVVDRIQYGAVADFLNMSCCGISNPFSFNIADVCIFAGALGLILFAPSVPSAKG